MDERISESRSCSDFSFFFSPILFLFYFPLSLSFSPSTREGRKETKPWIGEEKLKEGGGRAEVLEDGQAFLDRRQKTSSPVGEKEGS